MAYQETTGNSPDDVIDKIATFAAAAGWTIATNSLVGSNRTLVMQKSGDYIQIWNTDTSNIFITGYIGYVPGTAFNLQVGYAGNYAQTNLGTGPYANVFMFADDNPSEHVHVVIELAGGVFRHLSFGMLDKLGTWTGGTYFDATIWSTSPSQEYLWNGFSGVMFDYSRSNAGSRWGAVRCDIPADSKTDAWAYFRNSQSYRLFTGLDSGGSNQSDGRGYLTTQFYNRNDPPFSGQVTLGTIAVYVIRTGGFWSPIGTVPNCRYLNMARYSPGQEPSVASDAWKVFPFCRKGTGSSGSGPFSNNHAFAFKKVV